MRPPRLGTFLFFLGLYALTQSGRFHVIDEYETFFVAHSLVERCAIDIPQAAESEYFFGKWGPDGKPYAPYGIGQPAVTLPFLLLGKSLGPLLPVPEPDANFWLWFFASLSSCVLSASAVVLFQVWLSESGVPVRRVAWAGLLFGLGTLVWAYAAQYRSNTVLLAILLGLLVVGRRRGAGWCVGAFFLAFIGVLVRADSLISIAIVGCYLGWPAVAGKDWKGAGKSLGSVALGAALGIAATLALNWFRFGSAFDNGYPLVDDGGRPAYRFGSPDPVAFAALLFSPGKGLFVFSPLLFLGALRLPALLRVRPREACLVVALSLSYLILYSSWQHYEGGWCFGPRFLLILAPFLLLPLVHLPWSRSWIIGALVCGVIVNFSAISVNFLSVAKSGGYYENLEDPLSALRYNVFYNPLPAHVAGTLENWAEAAVDGGLTATPIGEGLDTWWATALKESIPRSFIVWIILIQASTLAAGAGLLLSAAWRDRSRSAAGARDVAEPAVDKTAQLH